MHPRANGCLYRNLNDDLTAIKEIMQHLRGLRASWAQVDADERRAREAEGASINASAGESRLTREPFVSDTASRSDERLKIAA